ncbi:hypothetical protein CR513_57971, partial [Mucuna pruriens]
MAFCSSKVPCFLQQLLMRSSSPFRIGLLPVVETLRDLLEGGLGKGPMAPKKRRHSQKCGRARSKLRTTFESMCLIDLTISLKQLFDGNQSDTLDGREFWEEMKKIMLANTARLGSFPIWMILEDDPNSLL